MKVSIVTAVYNRSATIGQTIESIRSQTYPDVEHIIQDGGSTDGTLDILAGFPTENLSLESAPDSGIYDAINKGIARATGDIVGLLHSDDFFARHDVIETVARAFDDPAIDGVYGDLDYVSASDTGKIIRRWRSGSYAPKRLKRGWMPPHPTVFLRREVFDKHGTYDTSFRIAADYDAMLRYLWRGKIRLTYIPEVLVKMRVGGESNRSLSRIVLKSREDYRAIRRNDVGGVATLVAKNASKIPQFLARS